MKDDLPYLKHVVDAVSKIEDYVKNVKREKFLKDAKTQDAVVRELEVIGEATKRLSGDIRQRYPEIPWTAVAGARDRLIHAYFDVDLEEVWKTVCDDIPHLKRTVEKMIAGLER